MTTSGPGTFFDGRTSDRHAVIVELDAATLLVRAGDGRVLARWPYGELEQVASQPEILRLARAHRRQLERLEIRDATLAAAIDALSLPVDRTGTAGRRSRRKVLVWMIVAVASLVLAGIVGVPALATRLVPTIPYTIERKLGAAVDQQFRAMLGNEHAAKPFECGGEDEERPGRAALDRLLTKLDSAAALPMPLNVAVIRRSATNAVALPGGRIYMFHGLIAKAENPDEVAGVLAHEIGHVAHRDGTRSVLESAGLSFLFGMVLGDFVGGGAAVLAARTILQLSYSRDVETAADVYAIALMAKVGGDAGALARILDRIAGAIEPGHSKLLQNHPQTRERVALIDRLAPPPRGALMDAADWAALRRICAAQ
jgi:Zn-dependent protease with chaperone function